MKNQVTDMGLMMKILNQDVNAHIAELIYK